MTLAQRTGMYVFDAAPLDALICRDELVPARLTAGTSFLGANVLHETDRDGAQLPRVGSWHLVALSAQPRTNVTVVQIAEPPTEVD